ncbi:MAG: DUF2628 domain-containing protein [Prevotella sp.]|jgi:hypothetical protein|nr:DUF2628 domain-containing protein [Prevotella sp.]
MLNDRQENSLLDDIIDDKLYYRTFFGKDPDYYEERYEKMLAGSATVFNAYAFFLGFFWLAYRKMYVEIAALVGIMVVIECIMIFALGIDDPSIDRVTNFIWAIIIGLYANTFYFKKAERTVRQAKEMYANTGDQLDYVEKEGGVSAIGPWIVGAVFVAIVIGTMLLYDYLAVYDY